MNDIVRDTLIAKIAQLPDERVAEIMTFVDFVRAQEEHRALVRDCLRASEPAFAKVWDNEEDDIYNDL
ncbi:hypothetical protein [Brevundimonas aurifodinae]|uniref:Toxin-antitoxin system, antitoxin component, Xre family protein n=2 Tax=Brevundimonas TaxID=41275 RepID=A0ABV1NPG7_9CAUL|nr:MAG: hypothetical protein B7Z42_03585 [Brevundimonas sp. 12-68-7]OYX35948.1 MAG: hypothetical protein B7Z01_01145 [Brevundimonas subvibrioides]